MESKQRLIIVKVERLQELQSDLDRIHQEQATLVNELVQLTSIVPDYTLSLPTRNCVDSQVTSNIGYTEEDTTLTAPQPLRIQSTTTPVKNTQKHNNNCKWAITYTSKIKSHILTDPMQLTGPVSSQT